MISGEGHLLHENLADTNPPANFQSTFTRSASTVTTSEKKFN